MPAYKKSNFGGAFFFLSKEKKQALSIIYAFCRLADDIVDEGFSDAKQKLDDLRKELDNVYEGCPKTELGKELLKAVKPFNIPKQYLSDLLDGCERDLKTPVRYESFGDLQWYMYRVASTVGLMCIKIFGYKNERTEKYAVALGYAVQLTNIVRDAAEDAKINRIYIPKQDLESFGVKEEDILKLKDNRRTKALLFFEAQKAQELFIQAEKLLPKEDFKAMLPARAMGNTYKAILAKLIARPCRLDDKKIKLNKIEKIRILFNTWRNRI